MNRARWFVSAVAVAVSVALAGPAAATQHQIKQKGVPGLGSGPALKTVIPCPAGWKPKGNIGSAKDFACEPIKPAPIQCPEGTEYYQLLCEVGCMPTPRTR